MTITFLSSCWCYGMYCSSIATTFPSFVVIQYGDDSAEPSKERKSSANRLRLTTVRSVGYWRDVDTDTFAAGSISIIRQRGFAFRM